MNLWCFFKIPLESDRLFVEPKSEKVSGLCIKPVWRMLGCDCATGPDKLGTRGLR